jgi:hypothetical protein
MLQMQNARWFIETTLRAPKATRLLLDLLSRLGNVNYEITVIIITEDVLRLGGIDFNLVFVPTELHAPLHVSSDGITTILSRGMINFRIDFAEDALYLRSASGGQTRIDGGGDNGVDAIGDRIDQSLFQSGIVVGMLPRKKFHSTR